MKTALFSPLHILASLAALSILTATTASAQQPVTAPDNDMQKLELPSPTPLSPESQELKALAGPEMLPLSLTANISRFTGTAIIELTLPYSGDVTVMVADMYGNIAASLLEMQLEAGHHVMTWTPGDVRPGIYFITARMGDQVRSVRVEVFE